MKRLLVYVFCTFFMFSTVTPNLLAAQVIKQNLDTTELAQFTVLDSGSVDDKLAGEMSQGTKTTLVVFAFLLALGSLIATLKEADSVSANP